MNFNLIKLMIMPDKNQFSYVKPTDESINTIISFRDELSKLYDKILQLPMSRERSLAITKLEETTMWINKAIVFNQSFNQNE